MQTVGASAPCCVSRDRSFDMEYTSDVFLRCPQHKPTKTTTGTMATQDVRKRGKQAKNDASSDKASSQSVPNKGGDSAGSAEKKRSLVDVWWPTLCVAAAAAIFMIIVPYVSVCCCCYAVSTHDSH